MTAEFFILEQRRLELVKQLKEVFRQSRKGGYSSIVGDQWNGTSNVSSEPSPEAFALIRQIQSIGIDIEPE